MSDMTTMTMSTEDVLAMMLTEDTGRHMLDSGGAYGRNWERNAGMTVEAFMAEPSAWINKWGDITVSTFHYLRDRLEYSPAMDRLFDVWLADNESNDPWFADLQAFVETVHQPSRWTEGMMSGNSYNGESYLSQTVQWVDFTYNDESYVGLQIHGGCDVRGGYTRPRFFKDDGGYWWADFNSASIFCTENRWIPDMDSDGEWLTDTETVDVMGTPTETEVRQWRQCDWGLYINGGEASNSDGYFVDVELGKDMNGDACCPECGGQLGAEAPYPPY